MKFAHIKNGRIMAVSEASSSVSLPPASPLVIPVGNSTAIGSSLDYRFYPFQHLQNVEVELTTKCNLKCIHCDRRCRQAPSDEEMTISQIEYFASETKRLYYEWRVIRVLGGEPSMHSNLFKALEILLQLKANVEVVTNGYGIAENISKQLPAGIILKNTKKKSPFQKSFVNVDVTMLEKENVQQIMSCQHVGGCGIGLTRYGFYPCGPGASIDRVLGFDIGIKQLALLSPRVVNDQQKVLCQYCGWSTTKSTSPSPKYGEISMFWERAYQSYKNQPKVLKLYGH